MFLSHINVSLSPSLLLFLKSVSMFSGEDKRIIIVINLELLKRGSWPRKKSKRGRNEIELWTDRERGVTYGYNLSP